MPDTCCNYRNLLNCNSVFIITLYELIDKRDIVQECIAIGSGNLALY